MGKASSSQTDLTAIREEVKKNEEYYLGLLREGAKVSFTNLADFQSWVMEKMRKIGLQVDEFIVDREELANQPAFQKMLRENPSALRSGTPNFETACIKY